MTRSFLFVLETMMIGLTSAPSYAVSDRNNEPACAQIGNVDPRCF
jgi:hypothetical protein